MMRFNTGRLRFHVEIWIIFIVVTDLLMARTRLRLGENLACMVYLHRWNYHKHLVFYTVVMEIWYFFFFTHEIILKSTSGILPS